MVVLRCLPSVSQQHNNKNRQTLAGSARPSCSGARNKVPRHVYTRYVLYDTQHRTGFRGYLVYCCRQRFSPSERHKRQVGQPFEGVNPCFGDPLSDEHLTRYGVDEITSINSATIAFGIHVDYTLQKEVAHYTISLSSMKNDQQRQPLHPSSILKSRFHHRASSPTKRTMPARSYQPPGTYSTAV